MARVADGAERRGLICVRPPYSAAGKTTPSPYCLVAFQTVLDAALQPPDEYSIVSVPDAAVFELNVPLNV